MLRAIWRRPGALVALVGGAGGGLVAILLPLAEKEGEPCSLPTYENVQAGKYPFTSHMHIYANREKGKPLDPLVREYARMTLSKDDIDDAPQSARDRNWLQAGLVGVLLILLVLLTYETYSLVLLSTNQASVFWPITWFVRCISTISSPATFFSLVVVCIMCGFFGKWLWYRPRKYTPRRERP